MIRRALDALTRCVVRRRRWWMLGILLSALAAVWLASRLTFRLDADDFLPSLPTENDSVADLLLSRFGASGRIVVVLESDQRIVLDDVTQIFEHLAARIRGVPGVQAVEYRLPPKTRQFLTRHGPARFFLYLRPHYLKIVASRLTRDGIERALLGGAAARESDPSPPLFRSRSDPLGIVGFAAWTVRGVTGTHRVRLVEGYFSVPGGRKFLLTVQPEAGMNAVNKATALVSGLEQVLREAQGNKALAGPMRGKRLLAVGRPVSYVHGYHALYGDVRRIAIGVAVIVPLLLVSFFRRVSAPLVLMLPIICGLAIVGGAGYLLFGTISLMAWIFIGVLIGMGVDFGIHVATHYWVYGEVQTETANAVASAVVRPGRGIVFGGLTSAAAFFSIQVSSYPAIKQVAWLTSIGILAILFSSVTLLPIALSHSRASRRDERNWHRWSQLFERATRKTPLLGTLPWVALLAAALFAARFIDFEPHPWKLAIRGNPKTAQLEQLSSELGSSFTPLLLVSQGETPDEAIVRDREATQILRRVAQQAGVASVVSLSNWLPAPEQQRVNISYMRENPEIFSPSRFAHDFRRTAATMESPDPYLTQEYLSLISDFLDSEPHEITLQELSDLGLRAEIDRHLWRVQTEYLAVSYVYLRDFPWAEGAVNRFLDTFFNAGAAQLTGVRILGDALRSSSHSRTLRRDVLLATLLALTLVAGILWMQFRSVSSSLLCLLPLVCGLSAAALVMAFFQIELNMLTLTIAPLLVGIGVDDGIHITERLHSGEPSETVLREAGSSMTMTTATTVAALACLGLGRFEGVREVGLVGSVGLAFCLLAALHLVPLFFGFLQRDVPDQDEEKQPASHRS